MDRQCAVVPISPGEPQAIQRPLWQERCAHQVILSVNKILSSENDSRHKLPLALSCPYLSDDNGASLTKAYAVKNRSIPGLRHHEERIRSQQDPWTPCTSSIPTLSNSTWKNDITNKAQIPWTRKSDVCSVQQTIYVQSESHTKLGGK